MTIVFLGVIFGKTFDDSGVSRSALIFSPQQLSIILPAYAALVSILPVWVLLCPRDYLSSYLKVGVIVLLGIGILVAQPTLKMPATTPFIHGGGPITGTVWPFVCIVIACGALSGFHALIASGTTPKMLNKESDMRADRLWRHAYGGVRFVDRPGGRLRPGTGRLLQDQHRRRPGTSSSVAGRTSENYQWDLRPREFDQLKADAGVKEDLSGRTAGAVTLALGMAKVLAGLPLMKTLTAYLYHFVIMFEALFILTLLETGTRVARFILQELFGHVRAGPAEVGEPSWAFNVVTSLLVCARVGILALRVRDRPAVVDDGDRQPTAGFDRAGRRNHLSAEARAEAQLCPLHGHPLCRCRW